MDNGSEKKDVSSTPIKVFSTSSLETNDVKFPVKNHRPRFVTGVWFSQIHERDQIGKLDACRINLKREGMNQTVSSRASDIFSDGWIHNCANNEYSEFMQRGSSKAEGGTVLV